MDQYGEELYYQNVHGPIEQEMQAPPREFYAARTMPNLCLMDDYEERVIEQEDPSSSSASNQIPTKSLVHDEAAQTLLNDRLGDLAEKLVFIKNNIIQIGPAKPKDQDDSEFDRTTLHTLHHDEEAR
jgi:hypothetical protein